MTAPFSSFPGDTAEAELARPVPSGGGMAARIRAFDWGKTPLGPIESWPQSRKTVVDLMLGSEAIMAALWGPEGILLYNDAYARLIGPRGATALGRPVFEALPELRELLEPQFAEVRAGRTLRVSDFLYPFVRNTALEDAWFDISYTPVRDEQGKVVAVLAFIVETTERVLSERRRQETEAALHETEERQRFLLALGDALRAQSSTNALIEVAARLLGEHLAASRILFAEFDETRGVADIFHGWFADGAKLFPVVMRLEDYEGPIMDDLRAGRTVRIADARDPALARPDLAAIAELGVMALLSVPLVAGGRLVVNLSVHQHDPRHWTDADVALAQDVAERLWADLVRARAEERLRESEQRLAAELSGTQLLQRLSTRLIPERSPEALYEQIMDTALELMRADAVSIQLLEDDGKRLRRVATRNLHPASTEYWTWVDASHASTCGQALGKNERVVLEDVETAPELTGTGDLEAFRASGTRAVQSSPLLTRTGRPIGMISTHWRAPRQFDESDFSLLDILARQVADLLERSQTEAALRESEERQTFLLKLSDAMRAEQDPQAIASTSLRLLNEYLRLDRSYIASIHGSDQPVQIVAEQGRPDLAPMPGWLQPADFPEGFKKAAEGILVVDNIWERQDLSDLDRRSLDSIALTSFIVAPLHRGAEGMIWALVAGTAEPRPWTSGEALLLAEAAERIWTAMERAGADAALRESEKKYRTLFETMGQGYVEAEIVRDVDGRAVDVRLLRLNPAFERLTGVPAAAAQGRTNREIFPDIEDWWVATADRIVRRGAPERVESELAALGRWYEAHFHPAGGDRFTAFYEDITERKHAEEMLRESEERQTFLLKLSDALRPLADPVAVQETAARLLAERLGATRAYYVEYDAGSGIASVARDYVADGSPSVAGQYTYEAYRTVLDRISTGRTWIVSEVGAEPELAQAERESLARLGVVAWVNVPLRKEGQLVAIFCVVQSSPRQWTADEIGWIEDVADRTWAAVERARAEERLRESEVRYRSLIGATNQVLYRHNPDWSEMRQLTGGGFLEDTNSPDPGWFSRYILPEDQPYIWAAIQEAIRKKSIFELEHRVIRADGTVGWTLSRSIPVFGDNGEIVEWFGAASDVSARREMEEALRESESRYRILFEATGTPYLVLAADAPRFTITDVNGAYLDVTMTRREALLGRGVFEAFPENPDDPGGVGVRDLKASLERVLDSGHPDTLPVLKYDIRRPDGTFEERYWIAHNTPIFDGASTAAGIVHRAEDVTGYVRLRARGAELSEKTERLESEIVAAGQRLQQTNERLRESEARLRKEAAGARSLHLVSSLLIREEDVGALYSRIVDAAAVLMHSNAASIQIVSGNGDSLQLLAWKGFHPEAAAFWKTVTPGSESSCGVALRQGKRIVVPDAENCAFLAGTEDLKYYRISNIRAVQSTPLLSRTGRMLGMISTHWREPHEPTEDELRLFDVLARQAADLIERGRAEWRLRESEARQRQILNSATDYAIIAMDLAGRVTLWNEGAQNVLGWSEGEMLGQTIEPIFTSEDVAAGTAEQEMRDALARGHGGDDRWQVRKSGERFWANGEVTPLAAENGETIGFVKVLRDRTQERRAEEHQELLINELNHRVKNTLVTVQSFAGQTLRNTERSADARALLESRLTALARAHDVLTRESWKGADVRNIVNRALDPFRTPQRKMVVEGPEARLSPRQALALSMALHELATNAVKYGALSGADGTIQVTWTVAANNGAGELDLTWREQDGPRVVPPKRKGFGSRLIERNLSRELGGEAKIEYRPDGIVANIKAPLEFGGGEFHNPTR